MNGVLEIEISHALEMNAIIFVSWERIVLKIMVIFGNNSVFTVLLVLFLSLVNALEDVEPTKSMSIEFVLVPMDSQDKEKTVWILSIKLVELIKFTVNLRRNVSVLRTVSIRMETMIVLNAHLDHPLALMENLVFVTLLINFGMLKLTYAKIDAALINNGSTTSVNVFQLTVGIINNVDNVLLTHLPPLTEPLVYVKVPLLTLQLNPTHVLNVMLRVIGFLTMTGTNVCVKLVLQTVMGLVLLMLNVKITKFLIQKQINVTANLDMSKMGISADLLVLPMKFGMENSVFVLMDMHVMEHAKNAQMEVNLIQEKLPVFAQLLIKSSLWAHSLV